MSEFQTSLLLIGAVVVAGVFGYNKWQEKRAGRAADEAFRSRHPDVLIGSDEPAGPSVAETDSALRIEPGIGTRPLIGTERAAAPAGDPQEPDPRVDYIVELQSDRPLAGTTVLELWAPIEHRFAGRAIMYAWSVDAWGPVLQHGACDRLCAVIQLVSRRGVLGEGELLEFRSEVETIAARLDASVHALEMRDSLEAARKLDDVCAEADIQVAFHVVASNGVAFTGTKLRAAAEASGFVLAGDGRFRLSDELGRELYSLGDRGGNAFSSETMKDCAPVALTLSMDVPRAPNTQRTFEAMVRFGRHLALLLAGAVVDDNNRPLDDRAVAAIEAQLSQVRNTLDVQGLTPGSALALRLFS